MEYSRQVQGQGGITVLVLGCVHGDELIGEKVIRELRKLFIKKGTLITVLANTEAMKMKKRFIEQDLNRSFPGNPKGNYEERLAYSLRELLEKADFVLDIHSTTTDTASAIILTKVNSSIRKLIKLFHPKRVIVMEKKVSKTALTAYCQAGISFEYGKDRSSQTYRETIGDIKMILRKLGMIDAIPKASLLSGRVSTKYFKVFGALERESGFILLKSIRNFLFVRKGSVVAQRKSEIQKSPYGFYPILFGPKSYKEIWGFVAHRVTKI